MEPHQKSGWRSFFLRSRIFVLFHTTNPDAPRQFILFQTSKPSTRYQTFSSLNVSVKINNIFA